MYSHECALEVVSYQEGKWFESLVYSEKSGKETKEGSSVGSMTLQLRVRLASLSLHLLLRAQHEPLRKLSVLSAQVRCRLQPAHVRFTSNFQELITNAIFLQKAHRSCSTLLKVAFVSMPPTLRCGGWNYVVSLEFERIWLLGVPMCFHK